MGMLFNFYLNEPQIISKDTITRNCCFMNKEIPNEHAIVLQLHYKNLPMQYAIIQRWFSEAIIENFIRQKDLYFFYIFALNIDVGTNEYPQSMFWIKNKQTTCIFTPLVPKFFYLKVGCKGVYITWQCFPDGLNRMVRGC